MVSLLVSFLKKIFGKSPAPLPPEPKPTGFNIGHEWPFPSPKPPNTDFLINQLIKGVRVEGEHVFYYWGDQKRRHLRTLKGTETNLAKHVVWWMEGRKFPQTANGLVTNCGEVKCIKLSHLVLKHSLPAHGPSRRLSKGPIATAEDEPKHVVKKKPSQTPAKLEKGDRSRCITRKVYFETLRDAQKKQTILNSKEVRGRGRRVYPYPDPCPYCAGWHLTKMKPGTYKKPKIKNSSW
jgi:hypothetical protein